MAKLITFSHFFLLFLLVSAVSMVPVAHARRLCTVELDPNGCILQACQWQCFQQHHGIGQCAHFGSQNYHCICVYFCL
ncbi:hypothetical protein L6164_001488 [Bauhinia variegata]|uniref:Uncharacterized protein n=1 Tax=Bauhinia variegata TaxID=167791 RepID=A0ACB9Q9P3_BAUVA|nr:hypothetical protein L6164_001488 [Bauhinia variegata]